MSCDTTNPDVTITLNEDGEPLLQRHEPTIKEKIKFQLTLILGLIAIFDAFIFIFLVPFIIDPSISTISAHFNETAGTCFIGETTILVGRNNCMWSSCREGCTTALVKCTQVYVNYSSTPYNTLQNASLTNDTAAVSAISVPLFINIKGCGYPPYVQCWKFDQLVLENTAISCYYSTLDRLAVVEYYPTSTFEFLILASVIPPSILIISFSVLSYWYCNCCRRRAATVEDEIIADADDNNTSKTHPDDDGNQGKLIPPSLSPSTPKPL